MSEGNQKVEPYMDKISEAIKRHLPWPSNAYTDIYNRAYEAVGKAIRDYSQPEGEVDENMV